jgi:hypothetical protein
MLLDESYRVKGPALDKLFASHRLLCEVQTCGLSEEEEEIAMRCRADWPIYVRNRYS